MLGRRFHIGHNRSLPSITAYHIHFSSRKHNCVIPDIEGAGNKEEDERYATVDDGKENEDTEIILRQFFKSPSSLHY
jgi:hypothetical protein